MRVTLLFLLIGLCAFLGLTSARAQTPVLPAPTPTAIVLPVPRPSPPGSGTICDAPTHAGGQTVVPFFPPGGTFQITLPAGKFSVDGGISDPGGEFVRVCYVEGNSAIFFDLQGREKSRVVRNPAANPVLDEIARSVKVGPASAPYGAPPVNNVCGIAPRSASAGDSIRFGSPLGIITVTLPPPGPYQFAIPGDVPGTAHGIFMCDVTTTSTVLLDWRNGEEQGRLVLSSAGGPALDRIVAGVQFQPAPPAPPAPFVPYEPPVLRPPDTGDAGLVGLGALLTPGLDRHVLQVHRAFIAQ